MARSTSKYGPICPAPAGLLPARLVYCLVAVSCLGMLASAVAPRKLCKAVRAARLAPISEEGGSPTEEKSSSAEVDTANLRHDAQRIHRRGGCRHIHPVAQAHKTGAWRPSRPAAARSGSEHQRRNGLGTSLRL